MYFDIIIKNGRVLDGTGNPWFNADVAIKEGKTAKIGRCSSDHADRVIDAEGLIVCPGFIDIHQHSDTAVLVTPKCESSIRQGITTIVYGNCGYSVAPISPRSRKQKLYVSIAFQKTVEPEWDTFKEYFAKLETQGMATNVASFVGHGLIRAAIMGWDARAPTEDELQQMKTLVAKAMEDGAVGLSTGLAYSPGFYAKTDEIIQLTKVVAKYGGLYTSHIREMTKTGFLPSVQEAIEIGEKAKCPVQVSHIETSYDAWGIEDQILQLIDEARNRGLDVTCDVTLFTFGWGALTSLMLPEWAFEGGAAKMVERLRDPVTREKMKRDHIQIRKKPVIADGLWDRVLLLSSEKHPECVGKNLAEIARAWKKDPWNSTYDILLDEGLKLNEVQSAVGHHCEDDIRKAMQHPHCMPETDASVVAPYGPLSEVLVHPRGYASFPLIFRKYVRGETRKDFPEEVGAKILSLEEAVRKCTSFPAQRLGWGNRGLLREGLWADITIFDATTITDKATYLKPHQYPEGIPYVIVNGTIVLDQGVHTGALPGKILRGCGYKTL